MAESARFGSFTADIEGCRLLRNDEVVRLQPRTFDLLVHLLRNPDTLHTRNDLLDELWPGIFVSDEALNQMIRRLRRALEDDARNPRYVATVPRRGYRFVAEVNWQSSDAEAPQPLPPAEPSPPMEELSDAFFGRQTELAELRDRAASGARLMTLLGPGGAGKTRLARRFAATEGDWPGGSWFVDLAEAFDLEGLLRAVAGVLQVPLTGDEDSAIAQLGRAFAARGRALFVLDNHEHVVALAERTLRAWLQVAPQALFLVTSRIRLRLRSEVVVPIGALDPEAARALFLERARSAGARLSETRDAESIDQLVADLDGAPLAIELAAGRARMMTVDQLRTHLDRRFQLLRSTDRDSMERHRSLQVVIQDSVERLEPWERSALSQLSGLVGRFSLATAEDLLQLPADAPWTLDVLQDLCDQSVLQGADPDQDGFLVLESVRRYLIDAGRPDGLMARARATVLTRLQALIGADPESWELPGLIALVMSELDASDDARWLADAALASARWLRERGPETSSWRLLDRALAHRHGLPPEVQVRLLIERAALTEGRPVPWLEDAEALARTHDLDALVVETRLARLGNQVIDGVAEEMASELAALQQRASALGLVDLQVKALLVLAVDATRRARFDEAGAHMQQALAHSSGASPSMRAGLQDQLGGHLRARGDYDGSARHYREACELFGALGWRRRQAMVLSNLAGPLSLAGRIEESIEVLEQARHTLAQLGVVEGEAAIQINLSANYLFAGRLDDAEVAIDAGWDLMEAAGHSGGLATLALNGAILHWTRGDLPAAVERFETGLSLTDEHGHVALGVTIRAMYAGALAQLGSVEQAATELGTAREAIPGDSLGQAGAVLAVVDSMVEAARVAAGASSERDLAAALDDAQNADDPVVRLILAPLLARVI